MSKKEGTMSKRAASARTDEGNGDDNDDMTISQLASSISKQLACTKREISQQLYDEIHSLKTDIRTDLEQMRSSLEKSVAELNCSVDRNRENILLNTDALSRSQLRNDLVISGVPFVREENLLEYFGKWCQTLGLIHCLPNVDIRRLHKLAMVPGKSYMILVQFAITNQRNDFYLRYLKSRSLTLDQLGFSSKDRVFVNSNLTVPARAIKSKALLAKRNGELHSVTTRDGIVYVKKNSESESRRVGTEDELRMILQSN